jgi:hypothetical protein
MTIAVGRLRIFDYAIWRRMLREELSLRRQKESRS